MVSLKCYSNFINSLTFYTTEYTNRGRKKMPDEFSAEGHSTFREVKAWRKYEMERRNYEHGAKLYKPTPPFPSFETPSSIANVKSFIKGEDLSK